VKLLAAAAVALALAAPASAASGLRVSLLGQTHTPCAGCPWAYYLRAWGADGKPWQGAINIQVVTPKGKKIDGIGMFAFTGSWLRAYIWRRPDKGQKLDLRIQFYAGTKVVDTVSYRVNVQ
jgi:hypothetical protein